jgi:hypothetical protein
LRRQAAYNLRKGSAEQGNSGGGLLSAEIMDFLQAQKELLGILKSISDKVDHYFWRLTANEPNSLCILLGIE